MKRITQHFRKITKSKSKRTMMMTFIFFFMGADAMLAYWLPGYLEGALGPAWMGIIIASSSVFGIIVDFLFPQIANHISIKKLLISANVSYLFYVLILVFLINTGSTWLFFIPMAVWGIYYELISFANQEFVSEEIPNKHHQKAWIELDLAKNMAYLFGPIIVGYLTIGNDPYFILFTALCLSLIALLPIIKIWKKLGIKNKIFKALSEKIHLPKHNKEEFKNWKNLVTQAWPLVSLHLTTIFADAVFWTGIAALSVQISKTSQIGILMFPAYMIPTILVPIFLKHQSDTPRTLKKMGSVSLLIGLVFMMFSITNDPVVYLALSFFLGLFVALIIPMSEGLFTKFSVRLKRKQRHVIGFQSSLFSFPYIVGPLIYGFISQAFGHHTAFGVISAIILIVSLVVLTTGIKDIKIKNRSILDWKN